MARKKKRGTRKKGYRFTAARRRAAMRNIKKARRMRTRGRKGGSKRRRGGRKSKALRRYRSRGMRVIRSRTRRGRRRGLTTLHRARRFLRGRRKVGRLAKAFARRWRMRSNPGVGGLTRWGITLISSGAWALGGLMGTGLIGGIVRATPLQGILGIAGERHVAWITSLVAALGLLWLTSRVGFLRRRQTPIMIGAGPAGWLAAGWRARDWLEGGVPSGARASDVPRCRPLPLRVVRRSPWAGAVEAGAAGLGAAAHLSLLGALLLIALVFAPWATAVALRIAVE